MGHMRSSSRPAVTWTPPPGSSVEWPSRRWGSPSMCLVEWETTRHRSSPTRKFEHVCTEGNAFANGLRTGSMEIFDSRWSHFRNFFPRSSAGLEVVSLYYNPTSLTPLSGGLILFGRVVTQLIHDLLTWPNTQVGTKAAPSRLLL